MDSHIVILDVRTLRVISSYQQPGHLGPISCLCLDRHHSWLLTGTLQGYLTLWDLRFGLLLRTWKAGRDDSGAVQSCSIHSTKGKGRWVIVALEGSEGFETWDIGTFECVERYIPLQDTTAKDAIRKFRRQRATSTDPIRTRVNRDTAAASDTNTAQAIEALLCHAAPPIPVDAHQDDGQDAGAALYTHKYRASQPAVKAIINGADYGHLRSSITLGVGNLPSVSEGGTPTQDSPVQSKLSDLGWIMSAGEDKSLVFWDLAHIEKSSVITGPDESEEKVVYAKESIDGTTVFTAVRQTLKNGSTRRSNLMATSQQNLLKAHQDAITTLALLELPFRCVVSGDRSGVIKVWE
jgi:phosphoinositide-3-kinase regulatory subunit 4